MKLIMERFQKFTNEQVGLGGVMPLNIGIATQAAQDEKAQLAREAGERYLIQQVNNSNQAVVDKLENVYRDSMESNFVEFYHDQEPILRLLVQPMGSEQNRREQAADIQDKFIKTFTVFLNETLAGFGEQLETGRVEVEYLTDNVPQKDPAFSKKVVARAPDRAKSTQLQFDAENIYRIPAFKFVLANPPAGEGKDLRLSLDRVANALERALDTVTGMRVGEDGGY